MYDIVFPSPPPKFLPNGAWCMPQNPLPGPGPDDAEPDGFPPDEDADAPAPEQGLFVTLPAEHLTLAGFCQGSASATLAPGTPRGGGRAGRRGGFPPAAPAPAWKASSPPMSWPASCT